MPWVQTFRYFAVKPLKAEHPIGSGTIVDYKVGEEIPAGEWGRSTDWLVENGKAVRMADNVWSDDGDGPEPEPPSQEPATDEERALAEAVASGTAVYPIAAKAVWFTLSDGSKVRGREQAEAAEAALGGES